MTIEERFWKKVEIGNEDECWNWVGAIDTPKYGAFKYNGKKVNSHRMAWFLTYGEFPELLVLHSCDNRKCCNPKHLFLGTHKDNVQDMISKNRVNYKKGSEHPLYILARHGTILSYKHGCRCKKCKKANSESKMEYRKRNKS